MRRAVSEYVSAIMLAIIVLASGAAIYIYAMNVLDRNYQRIENELIRAEHEMRQSLSIVASYFVNSNATIIVVSGDYPVKILDIYINNTVATPSCELIIGANKSTLPYTLRPYTSAVILCSWSTAPSSGTSVPIKIVYEGGEVEALAQQI